MTQSSRATFFVMDFHACIVIEGGPQHRTHDLRLPVLLTALSSSRRLKDRASRTVHWREKKTSSKAWRLGFVAPFTVLRNGYYRLATASTGATCLGGEPFKCCGGPGTGNIMACKSYSR